MILSVSGPDSKTYLANPLAILVLVVLCPLCLLESVEQVLAKNGSYPRWIPNGSRRVLGRIFRKYCSRCRVSFSLLPEFLLPRQRHRLGLVAAWLWEWLQGTSARCRDFYLRHGIKCPEPDDRMCWSDLLDQPGLRTRPGYQLLYWWAERFSQRAARLVPELRDAVEGLTGMARTAGEALAGWRVPEAGRSLAHAWIAWEALWRHGSTRGELDPREAFAQLVRFLARDPLPRSHPVRLASGNAVTYDCIVIRRQMRCGLPP